MAWVRSEYAGELAVVMTWAAALLPWSFSVASQGGLSFVVIRFQWFLVRYIFGANLGAAEKPFQTVVGAVSFPQSAAVVRAYWLWVAASAVFLLAFALSVAYYAAEERVEASRVDPVRTLGALLVVVGLAHGASWALLWRNFLGTTVPVGTAFELAFGGLLLTADRT